MGGSAGLKIGRRIELHLSGLKLNGDNLIDTGLPNCQGLSPMGRTGIRADPQRGCYLRNGSLIGRGSVWVAARSRREWRVVEQVSAVE